MNEKEMIEEMARDFLEIDVYDNDKCKGCTRYICNDSCDNDCFAKLCAKYFYNLHYRKIPEGAVVLTREEYKAINMDRAVDMLREIQKQIRKETAEKIINWFRKHSVCIPSAEEINEFAKQFGVEVEG